jgi:hypothetical protein
MPYTICFPVPHDRITRDGHRVACICIPFVVPPHLWTPPDPGFLVHPDLDSDQVRHLQFLATIDQVAEKLPADLSREIQASVAAHMQTLGKRLGHGITLSKRDA